MRRTARVLSAAALAGAVVGFAAAAAFADPAAQVSPATGSPGGSVTVSVTCESSIGSAPATLDATSQAFDQGTVRLQRVPGGGDDRPVYRGTARIAPATDLEADGTDTVTPDSGWTVDGNCPAASGGQGKAWNTAFQVVPATAGATSDAGSGGDDPADEPGGDTVDPGGVPGKEPPGGDTVDPGGVPGKEPTGDSADDPAGDPASDGGGSRTPCGARPADSCDPAVIQHGVNAGEGGTFTDSVPALVAGGLLIAGALGAAAYRLVHRDSTTGR